MIDRLIGLIAPHACILCSSEGSLLCDWCLPDAINEIPARCYRCRAMSQDSAVCVKCRKQSPLTHVWVRAVYSETARDLVYKLKFERAKAAAEIIAGLLDEALPYLPPDTIITYVPTAKKRIRIRGYDQVKLVARLLAERRGITCKTLLVRHGHNRQVGATKALRAAQASRNYTLKRRGLTISSVVIVDDILTTGATIEATARLLRQGGVRQVNAAVFAQKQ